MRNSEDLFRIFFQCAPRSNGATNELKKLTHILNVRQSVSETESERSKAMDMIINIISIILCIFILNMCE